MNTRSYDPNDPRLTAYALGELAEVDRAEVESQLEQCEESRATVEDVRETAELLRVELAAEPAVTLTETQRAAVEVEADAVAADPKAVQSATQTDKPIRRRQSALVSVLLTIAAVAVLVAILPPAMQSVRRARMQANGTVAQLDGQPFSDNDTSEADWGAAASSPDPNSAEFVARSSSQALSREEELFEYAFTEGTLADASNKAEVAGAVSTAVAGGTSGKSGAYGLELGDKLEGIPVDAYPKQPTDEALASLAAPDVARKRTYRSVIKRLEKRKQSVAPALQTASSGATPVTGPAPADTPVKDGRAIANARGKNPQQSSAVDPSKANSIVKTFNSTPPPSKPPGTGTTLTRGSQIASKSKGLGLRKRPTNSKRELERAASEVSKSVIFGDGIGGGQAAKGGFAQRQYDVRGLGRVTNNESYEPIHENEFLAPIQQPLSTVSVDVDTASYSNVRRFLTHGQWPNPNAVRIEELINYFHYDYPQPEDDTPFSVNIEVNACPWQPDHRLVRVGLKGKEISRDQRPPSSLVFLIDASGSMRDNNKLPLVKSSLQLLVEEMTEDDRIAIVTYSGRAGLQLDATSGEHKPKILAAINSLKAGGSTNGEAGIKMAYEQAIQHFIKDGTNRIILCTDGDFNVGVSSDNELVTMIQDKARSGVFLSIFGFGMGNLKDSKLEKLADKGNGHYGYVDNLKEARKIFVEEMTGTLYTIAKDVKVQIEFNPFQVGAYRLIGYENRLLAARDFNDDTKDAGDIGAGHTVTVLYEIVPIDKLPKPNVDPLKYQRKPGVPAEGDAADAKASKELLTLKLRYKQPDADKSMRRDFPVIDKRDKNVQPSSEFEWAAAVASFGMILRHSKHKGQSNYDHVLEMALGSKGPDKSGHRREFIDMLYRARVIQARQQGLPTPEAPQLTDEVAQAKATVRGKYKRLLKTIAVPNDAQVYGAFSDYGLWTSTAYAGHDKLPEGHWVYVYPNWYIWGDAR